MNPACDANRRLAELALWLDQGASWIDNVTGDARRARSGQGDVEVTFNRTELEIFVTGLRGATRSLLGLVQPVPPDIGERGAEAICASWHRRRMTPMSDRQTGHDLGQGRGDDPAALNRLLQYLEQFVDTASDEPLKRSLTFAASHVETARRRAESLRAAQARALLPTA